MLYYKDTKLRRRRKVYIGGEVNKYFASAVKALVTSELIAG